MLSQNDVTIIIPTLNTDRNNYARNECLISLRESGFPMKNVIVVFNGIDDSDIRFVGSDYQIMFIKEQGQCRAVNQASDHVKTNWLMVSNDDMVYPPDWFERLMKGVSNDRLASGVVVSPQLIEPNSGAPTFKKVFFGGIGGDWKKQEFMEYANTHSGTGIRSGFNLPFLIKKEIWDLVGGYDINYDPWGSNSDSDLEYKLKLAGIKMYQNTNCPVYHFSQTSNTFHPENRSYWQKNWNYFIEKWGFPRTDDGIWTADFEIPYDKLKYRPKWAKIQGKGS